MVEHNGDGLFVKRPSRFRKQTLVVGGGYKLTCGFFTAIRFGYLIEEEIGFYIIFVNQDFLNELNVRPWMTNHLIVMGK